MTSSPLFPCTSNAYGRQRPDGPVFLAHLAHWPFAQAYPLKPERLATGCGDQREFKSAEQHERTNPRDTRLWRYSGAIRKHSGHEALDAKA